MKELLVPIVGMLLGFLYHLKRNRKVVLPTKGKVKGTGTIYVHVGYFREMIGGLYVLGIAFLTLGTEDGSLQVIGILGGLWFLWSLNQARK